MSFEASFKQILREKMTETQSSKGFASHHSAPTDPAHMAYLYGVIGRHEFQNARAKYPKAKASPQPQRQAHIMSTEQQMSFDFFKNWIQDLSPGFTAVELKKAFRRAALILHPDRGGRTEQFMSLQKHYSILRLMVPA